MSHHPREPRCTRGAPRAVRGEPQVRRAWPRLSPDLSRRLSSGLSRRISSPAGNTRGRVSGSFYKCGGIRETLDRECSGWACRARTLILLPEVLSVNLGDGALDIRP